jgi:hypothetical protein
MKGFIFSRGANFGRIRVHDLFRKALAKTVARLTNPVIELRAFVLETFRNRPARLGLAGFAQENSGLERRFALCRMQPHL